METHCHVHGVIIERGCGLENGFIDHLYTRLGTARNYSAIANLYNSQIATAHAKPFPACSVFTSRSLATASNSGDSSASALKSSLNGGSLPTDSLLQSLPCGTDLVKSSQCYDRRSVGLDVKHPSGTWDQIFFLSDSFGFVDVGRPLSREDGSVFYNVQYNYIWHVITRLHIHTIYMPSVSPGSPDLVTPSVYLITHQHGPPYKTPFILSYAESFRGKVFTEPFPSSGRLSWLIKSLLPSNGRHSVRCVLRPLLRMECYFSAVG
jgi:hypothetical protein